MEFSQLKSSLSQPKKIYLLEGEDVFFRSRGEAMLKSKFLTEPDFNLTNLNGGLLKANLNPLLDALPMCPFLGDYRVIVISEWYPKATDFKNKELKAFFTSPLDTTMLIINNQSKCDVLKKQPQVEFVDCKKADMPLIAKYLQNEAMKHKLIISRSSCELIAQFCLFDMNKISLEIQKLISYCDGQAEITENDINTLVNKETDYKIFEIVKFIAERKQNEALEALREMIAQGETQILLVSVYYHFRKLLHVSLSNKTNSELAQQLGTKEFFIKILREQARSFTPKRLMSINKKLIEYDTAFKSGKVLIESAVENAVLAILNE